MRAFINIEVVRVGLARSVDHERGSRIDLLMPAPTTHPVTHYNNMLYLTCTREGVPCTCTKENNPIFSSAS